jgi:hypothetical protein
MNNEKNSTEDIFIEDHPEQIVEKDVKSKKLKKKEKDIFNSLQGKFIHIKVGSDVKPSTDDDINSLQDKFDKYMEDNDIDCIAFVTHHAVEIHVI